MHLKLYFFHNDSDFEYGFLHKTIQENDPYGYFSLLYYTLNVCEKKKKSRIRETQNLSTDADSSTDIIVSAGVKIGADIFFFTTFAAVDASKGAF